jgi:uncharacterized protein Yka (UPF0111/DUF47 family)
LKIIDSSIYQKEDILIKSITGEEYIIPGNLSTEFYIEFMVFFQNVTELASEADKLLKKKASKTVAKEITEIEKQVDLLKKEIVLKILQQDKSKTITMETIDKQFNNKNAIDDILNGVSAHVAEINADPN